MEDEGMVAEEISVREFNNPIDVRRQLISIKETKEQFKDILKGEISFRNLFVDHSSESGISPALCFLTVLHLANENTLSLVQQSEDDFVIKWKLIFI